MVVDHIEIALLGKGFCSKPIHQAMKLSFCLVTPRNTSLICDDNNHVTMLLDKSQSLMSIIKILKFIPKINGALILVDDTIAVKKKPCS